MAETRVRYTSYLTRPQIWALDEACKSLRAAGLGSTYWIGDQRPEPSDQSGEAQA